MNPFPVDRLKIFHGSDDDAYKTTMLDVQYEDYLRSRPELSPLIYSQKEAASRKVQLNKQPITEVKPGDNTVYVCGHSLLQCGVVQGIRTDGCRTQYMCGKL